MRGVAALTLAGVLLLGGCAKPVVLPVYPPAPSEPRFAFEIALTSAGHLQAASAINSLRKSAGGDPFGQNIFVKPLDVAARNGRIYVSDSLAGTVHVLDAGRGRYFRLGERPQGRLARPMGVAVDAQGLVYIADAGKRAVAVFDGLGLFQRWIGLGVLRRPVAVAVDLSGGRIVVVEADVDSNDTHGVVGFDREGKTLFSDLRRGADSTDYNLPGGVAMGREGVFYVLDAGNFRIKKLRPDGTLLSTWGGVGNRSGQFARPRDIATDDDGNVYVSDAVFGTIQVFDPDGRLLMNVGQFGQSGQPGDFSMLAGLGVDETGRIYAVDQVFRSVTVFRRVAAAGTFAAAQ